MLASSAVGNPDEIQRAKWEVLGDRCFTLRYEPKVAKHCRHEPLQHCRWLYSLGAYAKALGHLRILQHAMPDSPRIALLLLQCWLHLGKPGDLPSFIPFRSSRKLGRKE